MERAACRPPGRLRDWKRRYACSTVRCKLGRVCPHPELINEIQICARLILKSTTEAWALANFHVLRQCEERGDIPDLTSSTFSPGAVESSAGAFAEETTFPDDVTKIDVLHGEAGGLMSVNATNMVVTQFRKHFTLFVRLWYGISAKETRKVVRACYSSDASERREVLEMKAWLGSAAWGEDGELEQVFPRKTVIKKHVGYFVRKLYEIMVFVEQNQIEQRRQQETIQEMEEEKRTKKGKGAKKPKEKRSKTIKMFSLLPLSQSFALYNIKIDPSTLAHLCSRIYKRTGENVLGVELTPNNRIPTRPYFTQRGSELMRRAFNITQFETRRTKIGKARFNGLSVDEKARHAARFFGDSIRSDGYAASVLMVQLTRLARSVGRREENEEDEELGDADEFDDDPDSESLVTETNGEEITEDEPELEPEEDTTHEQDPSIASEVSDSAPYPAPEPALRGIRARGFVGVDPGKKAPCTAAIIGKLCSKKKKPPPPPPPSPKPPRWHRNKRCPVEDRVSSTGPPRTPVRRRREPKLPKVQHEQRILQIKAGEYQHMSGSKKFNKWHEKLRLRFPEYQIAISSLPCLKTADARVFLVRMEQVWLSLDYFLDFGIAHNFRKWRFFSHVKHRIAVDDVAKWLIPEAGAHKAMRKRATVVKVHEFRTSKLCSACYQPMKMAVFLDPNDPGPDELDADERPLYYDRSVLRCANKNCKKNFLNRDVNAAVNMQTLLMARLQGLPRPAEFAAGQEDESVIAREEADPRCIPHCGSLSRMVVRLRDDIERLDSTYEWLAAQVGALENKWAQLDAQLEASTPRSYYDRVLQELSCSGDVSLLLEALSSGPELSGASESPREHGMGEASTGRFMTLQERAEHEQAVTPLTGTIDQSGATNGSVLEAWLAMERKYRSRQGVVDQVQKLESDVAQKEFLLAAVAPERLLSRVKQTLSWVGDIGLLREALDPSAVSASKAGLRQLVLLEVGSPPRDADSSMATLEERVAKMEPAPVEKLPASRPRVVGRKRSGARAVSEGDLGLAHSEAKRPAIRSTTSRPITRSMGDRELWHG
ncbi:hypothetical protein PHYSODRAFT_335528 [Phytophthora sojae]|uniref:Cas12f1-like TNB domain-containing protein n=1 Tax=Phytophthora sojae (strain P6497) TaxID=1094619 RepID=G4ZRB4_PHYSP|nr:hypothetical protein PHYSODRAFT_335528 [Phytophthora sojae]EGZ13799.1 hypothetical protein PHYSODRAFT_335528 [Phytophthora sojae]|eukprot:XP_009531228.1 hypothetical protein PHYSODRAFT_335528 [Phytophthora sojae]